MFDRHDNQTFLFITVGSVKNRNVDAKDATINQTFLFFFFFFICFFFIIIYAVIDEDEDDN